MDKLQTLDYAGLEEVVALSLPKSIQDGEEFPQLRSKPPSQCAERTSGRHENSSQLRRSQFGAWVERPQLVLPFIFNGAIGLIRRDRAVAPLLPVVDVVTPRLF